MTEVVSVDDDSVSTRRYAREIAEDAAANGADALDLTGVEFVSRSVADELLHQSERRNLELRHAEGEVAEMLNAVRGDTATA
ncbi:hypothetical protein RYH80_04815 [Halobaculum sp. MBLA0147]|uniref:hypothetical protein n=1 Tax=Halobaculum sp. MBLA0147 TaxID=3079934 RepID=UPI00352555C2